MIDNPEIAAMRDDLVKAIRQWAVRGNFDVEGCMWQVMQLRIDLLMIAVGGAARRAQISEDYERQPIHDLPNHL